MTPRRRPHDCWFCKHHKAVRTAVKTIPVLFLVVGMSFVAAYVKEHLLAWSNATIASARVIEFIGEAIGEHILFTD